MPNTVFRAQVIETIMQRNRVQTGAPVRPRLGLRLLKLGLFGGRFAQLARALQYQTKKFWAKNNLEKDCLQKNFV